MTPPKDVKRKAEEIFEQYLKTTPSEFDVVKAIETALIEWGDEMVEKVLEKYGRHLGSCPSTLEINGTWQKCNCGFDDYFDLKDKK